MAVNITRTPGRASTSRAGLVGFVTAAIREELDYSASEAERVARAAEQSQMHFRNYVERVNPQLLTYEHAPVMVDVCEKLITGELTNVIIMMPPRYMKTEFIGRLLPGAFFERHPSEPIGLASYSAKLAHKTSDEARSYFLEAGGRLGTTSTAKDLWRVDGGGYLWATGVGGTHLGFGYLLGIIDDPTDPEKAHSPTYQQEFQSWFPQKFLSRRNRGDARTVVVMQRLGPQDPIDFLLRREVGEDTEAAPMNWHVVCLQEIRDERPLGRWSGPRGLPPTCTLEPDTRKIGEVLAPSRFDAPTVKMLQSQAGAYANAAQRQQAPASAAGDFWTETWFRSYDVLPDSAFNIGWDWDLAYTDDDKNSASAGIRSARGPGKTGEFPIYIDDVVWDWLEFPEAVGMVKSTGRGPHYVEAKASGKSVAQVIRRLGVPVKEVPVAGSKFTRSTLVQPVVSTGRVYVRRAVLRRLLHGERQGLLHVTSQGLVEETGDFDVNDAFVQALRRHIRRLEREERANESSPSGSIRNMR